MANYVLLETIQLTQSASSVTFDNIPQSGYTDLKIVMSARNTTNPYSEAAIYYAIGVNGQGVLTNITGKMFAGNGTSAFSLNTPADFNAVGYMTSSGATTSTFNNAEIYIPNYTSSNNKSFSVDSVSENNGTLAVTSAFAGLWSQTSAITSVTLTSRNGNFDIYSTFSLYGIAASDTTPASAPYATGGNVVATDGTYWYHAFLSTGTFTPQKALTCDILQVAGGGGGDSGGGGGGGGAGGYLTFTSQALTTSNYSVTIGAGGAGSGTTPSSGSNSQFGALTASVGGGRAVGGGASPSQGNGGSGGGATGGQTLGGGTATSGQGYNGGSSTFTSPYGGAGGGGAGGAGGNGGASSTAGAGGVGLYSSISGGAATGLGQLSGGNYYFAGGGGGARNNVHGGTAGAGGLGGGGNGGGQPGTSGTANTGGGGGGNEASGGSASNGGSGIVIIRYAI